MSKIGSKPISLKEGVSVNATAGQVVVKGPLGEIKLALPEDLELKVEQGMITVKRLSDDRKTRSAHGTMVRLLANAITGTTVGFEKTLEIVGTGFKGQMEGETLVLFLGFSHPVKFTPPEDIKITVVENKIKVFGINKEKVGIVADKIKKLRKPDVYKGKGIRFLGEHLRLKPGKMAAKAVGAGGK